MDYGCLNMAEMRRYSPWHPWHLEGLLLGLVDGHWQLMVDGVRSVVKDYSGVPIALEKRFVWIRTPSTTLHPNRINPGFGSVDPFEWHGTRTWPMWTREDPLFDPETGVWRGLGRSPVQTWPQGPRIWGPCRRHGLMSRIPAGS